MDARTHAHLAWQKYLIMVKNVLYRLGYAVNAHRLLFRSGPEVTVVCFHRISPNIDPLFPPFDPKVFGRLIRLLKKEYTITGFSNIETSVKPALVITFDDGYRDFYQYAMPVIQQEKITVNHNIVVNCAETGQLIWTQRFNNMLSNLFRTKRTLDIQYEDLQFQQKPEGRLVEAKSRLFRILLHRPYSFCIGLIDHLENKYSLGQQEREMMNWEEIIACDREGVEIGSHTMHHSSLAEVHEESFTKIELQDSKKVLEEKLDHPVRTIAFPNGLAHPIAYQRAIEAGYRNMLLISGVKYDYDLQSGPDIHPYKRILYGYPNAYENIFKLKAISRTFQSG